MNGQTYGREVAFNQTVINIGADSGNDIILKGESVADFHAMLHFENERWFIVSLDPSKTTNVNGHILGDLAENLQNSSVVTIGDYRLFFNLNGVNADIMIQSQGIMSEGASVQTEAFGSNILLEITNSTMTEIEAGATAEFELTVTNAGPLVANMQLQLQGVPTSWVQVIPPVLNLNEGRKGIFSVRISPPRDSSAEAGFYGLHFVASSPNYQQETGIADSSLTVLPYSEFLASGPTPRRLELTRKNQTDLTDVVILNNSNAATTFFVRSYDDANDLFFTYEREGSSQQGQETITIRPGDNTRVSMRIGSRKLPILGMRSHSYHYNTTITPSDQPGGGQSLMGEVVVKPLINTFWVLLTLFLLVVGAIVFFQPRIRHFDGDNGKRTLVALYGNPVRINWDVVPFASKVTMTDNSGEPQDMIKSGSQFIAPKVSSTYTLKAENIFSKMFNINYEKTIQVLVIPQSPTVSTLHTDISDALYNQQVTLNWAVSGDISKAALAYNKQKTDLTAENYTGTLAQGYTSDTLFSLKAQNSSGYDMRSLFLNVSPDKIDLKRFTVWVRPNGIAVPNNNDTRRTSRWSSLQLTADTNTSGIIRPAVNPMPEPQTNVLSIPDNYNNIGNSQGLNPEQIALSGQPNPNNGYVYSSPQVDVDNPELLVSPSLRPTVMPTAIPEAVLQTGPIVRETTVPPTSPEAAPYNRDFSVKLVEVVEDPLSESGYRIIDYFPDYQLQPKEQILVEWSVNGVSAVKITGLSGDSLRASGGDFAYPEKSLTYELEAEVGQVKKVYSLPVRVAGDADDGEGSGLKCELKANATTLKEPGSVMLSWTGGGTNRVQLVSSAKAEQDSEDAEKKKEQEAKEKGETYQKPSQPAQMTGGTIGDWLQPSGFMRVNVEKQTTFVLNAYDGNGNVICTKSVDVKLEGGNDKEDISKIPGASFKIVKIADDNDVSQPFYTVGQTVHYTIAMTGFPKGKEPSGSVVITDGTGSCTVTLPVTSCSFVAKKAGNLTVTAVYSGDNTYKKAQATAKERVINKLPTTLEIQAAFKPGATLANVISQLKFDAENEYGLIPTGVITFTVGSGTCDLDVMTDKLTCEGKAVENPDDGYWWTITNMVLTDSNADRITAVYKGDNYFSPSTAKPVLFYKIPTKTVISDAYKPGETKADFDTTISWSFPLEEKDAVYKLVKDLKPTGTITFTPMASTSSSGSASSETSNCVYDISAETLSCGEKPDKTVGANNILVAVRDMLVTDTSDRIRAVYSGDSFFNTSSHTLQFYTIPTTTEIATATMAPDLWITLTDVLVNPNPGSDAPTDKSITGTLTFRSGAGSSSSTQGSDTTGVSYTAVACIYDIEKNTFQNCQGVVEETYKKDEEELPNIERPNIEGNYIIHVMKIKMDGTPGETIMADYSGDSVYLKSSSQTKEINKTPKLNTSITIETASKNGDLIRLTAVLDPADGPTGKITFKSGSAVCNLTIDNRNSLLFEDCSGEAKYDPVSKKFFITDMVMNGTPGENIRAEYSGDVFYNKSISTPISFVRKDTKITIEPGATKTDNKINLTTVLDPAEGPTGEITFTSGSATCVLDIDDRNAPAFLKPCTGKAEFKDGKFVITDMVMDETPGSTIRAEYSGDGAYYGSISPEITFTSAVKIDTALVLSDASKSGELLLDFKATLSFNKEKADGNIPTGTIIFTIGNDTCQLNVANNEFDCTGESTVITGPNVTDGTDVKYEWTFTKVQLSDSEAKEMSAVYGGDTNFNPSSADTVEFIMIETALEIAEASQRPKSHILPISKLVDMTMYLSWDDEPPLGKSPTGKITLTSGSETCTFDFSADSDKGEFTDCDGEVEVRLDGEKVTFKITNLDMGSQTGTTISAKYSGDGTFLASSAADFTFRKIPTILKIEKALKPGSLYLNLSDLLLSWNNKESEKIAPTGTIKLTIGSDTCELTFDNKPDDGDFTKFTCLETGVTDIIPSSEGPDPEETDPDKQNDKIIHWLMQKILLSKGTTADRVKAEYSGDDIFEASSTDFILFKKIPTEISISKAYRPFTSEASFDTLLSWADTEVNGVTPTGNITFTTIKPEGVGSGSDDSSKAKTENKCVLTLGDKLTMDCEGKVTKVENIYQIRNMIMSDYRATRIKAEYSGDGLFEPSVSSTVIFDESKTTTEIINPSKSENNIVSMNIQIHSEKPHPEGRKPYGVILITSGSKSCILDFSSGLNDIKFTNCVGNAVYENDEFKITGLEMGSTSGTTIYAEYLGENAFFLGSTSPTIDFYKIDTSITVLDIFKSGDGLIDLKTLLSWNKEEASGHLPTGTITLTIGSDSCKLTFDNKNPGQVKEFSCSEKDVTTIIPVKTEEDSYEIITWKLTKVLLSQGNNADRVKAEYSGDGLFNPSSSEFVLIQTIPTTLDVSDQVKKAGGLVDLTATLSWNTEPIREAGPTGTIKLTMGSASCSLDLSKERPEFTDCDGTVSKNGESSGSGSTYSEKMIFTITDLKIGDGSGESIKAEYSGDGYYLASASVEKSFKKIDTTLEVRNAYKSETIRAFYDAVLGWETENTDNRKPTGTLTFTIGDTCKMVFSLTDNDIAKTDVDDPYKPIEFSCSDDKTKILMNKDDITGTDTTRYQRTWSFKDVLLAAENSADRIKAEYSGDAAFNPSSSEFLLLDTIPTTLEIDKKSKTGSGLVDVDAVLSWTDEPLQAGKDPLGTIKFTMGSAVCTLDISKETPVFTDCESDPVPAPADAAGSKTKTYHITNLKFADVTGTEIKAEYSGDGLFLASASAVKSFDKYDTELDIEKAYKSGTSYADLNTLLTWNKTEAGDKVPTGTITLTIGGDSCKLTFDNPKNGDDISYGHVKDFTCMEKGKTEITPDETPDSAPDTITWKMMNIMLSSGSTADRVKAEYSGDANFNPSTTEFVLFESIPTELKIIRMYPDFEPGELFVILQLSWTEEPSESGRIPTGTINLKVGDKVCPLRLTETEPRIHSDICHVGEISGEPSGKIWELSFRGIEMGEISKNSASTEYLGDNLFRASKYEHKVDTQTDIDSARMMPDGTVDITFTQQWDQILAGILTDPQDDRNFRPSGTFKITVGASSCTLQMNGIADPVFTDCEAGTARLEHTLPPYGVYPRRNIPKFVIEDLKIGDGTADGIKVEYSGDDLFNPSSSKTKYFDKADTVITVSKAFKSGDIRANWTSVLSWDPAAVGTDVPIGVITFAVGSDSCKLTLDPIKGTETNPKKQTNFTCADSTTEVSLDQGTAGPYTLTFTNVLLTAGNTPDRIKADYAGDALFNASASDFLLFETIPTTTTLGIGLDKTPAGLVNADITLRWESTPLAVGTPQGTIKLTSGSAACTLDLAANPVRFTDCSSNTVTVTPGDKQLTFTVKNLNMGTGAGEDLKAEYSGFGSFLPSASDKLSFTKVPTILVINSAYKPGDPGLANLITTLSWDAEGAYTRKPTGTIKFTAGSTTCDLDLTTRILTCGSKPVADWDRTGSNYRMVIEEMLLSDTSAARIKAEYSGDAVFNPSTAETVLFKTVDTEISVAAASKFDVQHATVSALLNWDESIADGRKPTGTVKFVIGSGNCTLTIETGKLSCEPGTGTVSADRKSYRGTRMLLDDSSADRVSVEYSGDGFFKPSTSTRVLFDRIDTTISMNKAYRYIKSDNKGYVWLDSLLNWDETEAEGRKPTGTIKITIKDKIAEYDMTAKTLTIAGEQISTESIVDSSNSPEQLIFMNLPLDAENAVNSRIEYSGDLYFGPSSTSIVYDKLPVGLKVEEVKYSRNEDASPRTYNFYLTVSFKNIASILNDVDFNGKLKTEITFNYDYYGDQFTITCENHSCTGVNDPYKMSANISMASGYFELEIIRAKYHWSTDHPKWITIRASYDGTEDLLYESSNTSYIYNSKNSLPSSIQNINAIQLSNGEKYIAFDLKFTGFYSNGPGSGRVEIITSNGKTCSVSFSGNSHTESAECKVVNIADGDHSTNSGSQVDNWFVKKWTLKGVKFDPNEADKVYIKFLGSTRTYDAHSSAYGESTFTDPTATTLAISSINHTDTGKMNMSLSLQYTAKELSNNYWPGGPLVITKGDYTCTIPLEFSHNTTNTTEYVLNLAEKSSDCGGGEAKISSAESKLNIRITDLPVTDQTTNTVKAEYKGDWSNKASSVTGSLFGRVETNITSKFVDFSAKKIRTEVGTVSSTISDVPLGTLKYTFQPSGNYCTFTFVDDETTGYSCAGVDVSDSRTGSSPDRWLEASFTNIPDTDTTIDIVYSGDANYFGSSGTMRLNPYEVEITPVTDNIYSDGRLYFNTGSGTVYYPYYPERYGSNAYSYCQQYPTPSDCHQLAYEFQLKVIVTQPEDSNIDMTGETITFSNGDMSPNSVTCNLISVEGGFGCTTDTKVHFTKTGNKTIKARYAGNGSKMLASANADFPVMIALSLTGEKTASFTDFVFAEGEATQFTAGETRTMKAKSFEYGNEGNPVSDPSYVFYTYNRSENRHVKSCTGYGCSLEITADADVVIVEFPGDTTFAPSMMEKTVIKPETGSPVSLDVTIGGGG